jgi:leucyl aminopeptidase
MRLSISSTNVKEWSGDVLVVGLPREIRPRTAVHLESRFPGVSSALSQQAFEGKTGQKLVLHPLTNGNPQPARAGWPWRC